MFLSNNLVREAPADKIPDSQQKLARNSVRVSPRTRLFWFFIYISTSNVKERGYPRCDTHLQTGTELPPTYRKNNTTVKQGCYSLVNVPRTLGKTPRMLLLICRLAA